MCDSLTWLRSLPRKSTALNAIRWPHGAIETAAAYVNPVGAKKGDTVTSQPKPTAAVFVGGNEHHDGTAACEYQKTDNFFC